MNYVITASTWDKYNCKNTATQKMGLRLVCTAQSVLRSLLRRSALVWKEKSKICYYISEVHSLEQYSLIQFQLVQHHNRLGLDTKVAYLESGIFFIRIERFAQNKLSIAMFCLCYFHSDNDCIKNLMLEMDYLQTSIVPR